MLVLLALEVNYRGGRVAEPLGKSLAFISVSSDGIAAGHEENKIRFE